MGPRGTGLRAVLLPLCALAQLCQSADDCPESRGSLCVACPTIAGTDVATALGRLTVAADPVLDIHLNQPVNPPTADDGTCDLYTSQCNRDDAACVVNYYGSQCAAPKFAGGAEGVGMIAAVTVEYSDSARYRSTVLAGPTASEEPLVAEAANTRVFDTSVLGGAAKGFSAVVLAGRFVFYIPGCYSARPMTVEGYCSTLVRFDSLCGQSSPFTSADCYSTVNVRNVLDFQFRNK